jgi:hypothetical protein
MSIPLRNFGKIGVQISAVGLGGHHLGGAKEKKAAVDRLAVLHLELKPNKGETNNGKGSHSTG